ncbi:MAG: hypothetical protein V3R64_03125 [Sphingomonadales bacterium]
MILNKRFAHIIIVLLGLTCAFQLTLKSSEAADIRGVVLVFSPYSSNPVPMPGIVVTLYWTDPYSQPKPIGQVTTDNFGFYYFHSLEPGTYAVVVNDKSYVNFQVPRYDTSLNIIPIRVFS